MQEDTKIIWIWILAIAFVIVSALYVYELRKPNNIADFNDTASSLQAEIRSNCTDMTTDAGRENCTEVLKKIQNLLSDFFPQK